MNPTTEHPIHPRSDTELVDNLEVILSTVRHQLGNSVNAIKVTLDVLKQNFDQFNDGKKKDYLDRGSHLLARQQVLIEAMKSYSSFDVREQADIGVIPFWEHVSMLAKGRLEGTGISLSLKSDLRPCFIKGSMMALDKIISCILENAVDALEETGQPVIEIEAVTSENCLAVDVRDNGRGISHGDLPRIRVPLFTNKPNRAGMGLSIAHKLLARMNGQMLIESVPGEGTCVRITLAAKRQERI
ncbi:MAG: sensor histidine kinase [Thermodesulfobacteriota bacterium]